MLNLSYSLADQNFQTAVSTGIYGLSMGLANALNQCEEIGNLSFFVNRHNAHQLVAPRTGSVSIHDLPVNSKMGRLLWDHWELYQAAKQAGNEWLFLPKGYASGVVRCPVKLAAYVHDLMPIIFADRYPDVFSKQKQAYFRHVYRMTFKHANLIFTNTEFTKTEIQRWARENHVKNPPIEVAGYGFDHLEPDASVDSKGDNVLVFTRKMPHKRSDLAIAYLQQWKRKTSYKGEIVCVGGLDKELYPSNREGWAFYDRLDFTELWTLMSSSRVAVHFSEYEGFGMPPPEAIMAGAVPVFSNVPPCMEVMRGTGRPFCNQSYESFAAAMEQAFATGDKELVSWRQTLLAHHNWRNIVNRVVTKMKQVSDEM